MNIDAVLENIRSTGKLEISLTLLSDDRLLKKLNESTINVHTVEIQSTCKLKEVLKKYSLPSCLKYLRITNNNVDFEDVFALVRSSGSVKNLHELDLSRTKFKENSFSCLMTVLFNCSDVEHLFLTDNGLTEEERNCLVTAFNSIKNLKNLNLSKNNLTQAQANDILQKHGEGKTIVTLDLSQNALEGDEIISKICKLKSLEQLNLSHNHITFPQYRTSNEESDNFLTNTKIISSSSNHMTSNIFLLPSLIKSDLVSLNLDYNHVGCAIWSLCPSRIKHLKVLSLANTDVSGPAVQGLANVLFSARELEELNLSSNNLMLEDFQQLVSPLSSLTNLKKLNLNNNLGGISVVLEKILPCMKYLEELRLSNTHLNGDDCNKLFESLKFLKELKYLDLSNNAIGSFGAKALADILKDFMLLEGLDLSKCCIQEDEISALFVGLNPLIKLKYLNLSGNPINTDEISVHSLFFSSTSTLEEVILSDIIHGKKLFPSMIPLQDQVRKLHLSEMELRPRDVEALAAILSSFIFLEELVLTDVHFRDRNCEKIFDAIGKIRKLKKLVLSLDLTLDNKKAFSDMLSCLSVLEEIVFPEFVIDRSDTECVNVLQSLVHLKNLDLSKTKIIDGKALADVLPTLQLLERLVLGWFYGNRRQLFLAVGKLKYLKELDLFRFGIHEFGAMALAEVLPSLQLLEILVLGNVEFNEESNKQLFLAVSKLKYLKKLSLSYGGDGSTDLIPLTEVLPSLRFLEELTLKDLRFDDGIEIQLFHAIGRLQYLKKLNLCDSNIAKTDVIHLAEVLTSLQWLEELELGDFDIHFDHECSEQLFCAIRELKYLKKLALLFSGVTQSNLIPLARTIPSLQWLEDLKLKNCFSNDESKTQLFHAVGKLKYLKKFTFRCFTRTQDYKALAEVLPSLQFLEKLHLQKSEDDDESDTKLFNALGNLKYLKKLALRGFRLTQTDAVAALSEALVSLPLLEKLVLKLVKFDDGCDVQLFHAVGKLKYLKVLDLCFGRITQAGAVILAKLLPTLRHLRKFGLPSYIKSNENETSSDQEREKSEALRNELKEAALSIHGLKVFYYTQC